MLCIKFAAVTRPVPRGATYRRGIPAMRRCLFALLSVVVLMSAEASGQGGYSGQRANAYIAAHDGPGALRYATAWTRAEPDNFYAWGALGAAYGMGLHQPENAIAAFKRGLAIRPDSPECLNAIGVEYFNLRRFADAANAFKRATEVAPTRSHYWNNLAAAYSETNNRDESLKALENNLRFAAPHGTWVDWYVLGNGFNNQKEYQKAVYAYQQSIRLNPQRGETWTNLGAAEQSLGQWDQALKDFRKGEELGNPLGRQNYIALRNAIAEAERRAREAASHSSGNPMADFNRARDREMATWNSNHPSNPWRSGSDKPD
jgi:tetratricopeptide (TPR) repeat protein